MVFGQKIENISTFSVRYNKLGKYVLRYSKKKNSFLDFKNKEFKVFEKFEFFSKGLVYAFGQKIKIFHFLLIEKKPKKMCLTRF